MTNINDSRREIYGYHISFRDAFYEAYQKGREDALKEKFDYD